MASLSIPTTCKYQIVPQSTRLLPQILGSFRGICGEELNQFEAQISALNNRPEALPMCGTLSMLRFDQRSVLMRLFPYLHVQFPQQLNSQECKPQV
jgi:hypothetical protein